MRKFLGLALLTFLGIILWGSQYSGDASHSLTPDGVTQMWRSHQHDLPLSSPLVAVEPSQPVETESVTYGRLNNQDLVGYLARPTEAKESLPALIVIHEWWGLNDNIKSMTSRLAGEGYVALAVDLYGGEVADNPEKARELVTAARNNEQPLKNNIRQAYQYLSQDKKAPKIASIGWCFGGTWSLNTALLFPEELDATVIYYGGGIETNPNQLKALKMPILGIFAELDNNPSVETVRQFEAALKQVGKSPEIYIYENADHAFANPSGTRYNAEAAEDAWKKTITFLNQHLK
ncbi:MAG: dienelactone hydrolase family protein [Limnoraphis robusta]|uniref:Carboxymethylenebutenolidase n=2 Tax=Limnoraphis robusta TaxID=1118279 RepID=A0A0F5YM74_9CYAN|nr:dienelactone hydrolase family protein [Limnoraphis robusta]KKD39991.1 carboxymethylenebutenolidase [Limnoraphis robusta CS-951]MEA5497406.1 dienelactone hydrolase family protein [Limnoraphis robusta BA-68 BA1]MEA5518783.1 dienelactone hydrolase family protein [Limnoraphis robusta CCNP1315]MEA5539075.1 dienelactone hydrolase family protein [Limnoraphis robusta Tam1]MEA5545461.1 dienelactone hydrolase family protein [Limnoraphis robusta CCNP1324]